jgi:hypothetical protein
VSVSYEMFEIYDTSGRRVLEGKSGDISVSHLPSGVYLLKIDNRKPIKIVRM